MRKTSLARFTGKLVLIILLMLPNLCFASNDWTTQDTIRESTFIALLFIDWRQTHYIIRDENRYEENLIEGKYPNAETINAYHAFWFVVHPLVSYVLPKQQRKIWQISSIFLQIYAVGSNYKAGVHMQF